MRLGTTEIILIVILALVLFGGGKLAGVGKALGKSIKVERLSLVLSLGSLLTSLRNPVAMGLDKALHLTPPHADGCRHMHITILGNAHRQSSRPSVCHLYGHSKPKYFLNILQR